MKILGYVTPKQRHTGEDKEILEVRKRTYQKAKKRNPNRWKNKTRDWDKKEMVSLRRVTIKKYYNSNKKRQLP